MRVVATSTFLSVLFLFLTTAALLIGQQQPPSLWSRILHLDDCELPCWIGIVPGSTTLDEAQIKIESAYADRVLYTLDGNEQKDTYRVMYAPTSSSFVIALTSQNPSDHSHAVVSDIAILFNQVRSQDTKYPTIPELYNGLGNSETIRLKSGLDKERIAVFFKNQSTLVFLNNLECDRIRLNQEITAIRLDPQVIYDTWLSEPHIWQGFGKCYHLFRSLE